MASFFCNSAPVLAPEDVIPFLAAQEKHWRVGRSAYELAHSWIGAGGIPASVDRVLSARAELSGARLLEGHFERSTPMPGRGRASQTDLLAVCTGDRGRFVVAVEGKVDETLGPLVREWDNRTPNRRERLRGLLQLLEIEEESAGLLRYQLLHRTAAALIEAEAFGTARAVMLVQSFSPTHAWFQDFAAFAATLGAPCPEPGMISPAVRRGETELYLGWCADNPFSRGIPAWG